MPALFRLKKPIGPNHVVDPDDTVRTKAALARLGYFEAPEEGITPWPDTPMITAIMDFQQARGLEPDGVINRGGPTEQAIQVQLDAQSDRPTTRRPDVDVSAASPRTRSLLAEDDGPASRRNGLRQRGERDGKGIESPAEIALSSGGGHFGDLPDKGLSRSEAALRWMKDKRDTFRHKGWSDAAANLEHYLSGKGTDKTYTREQARAFRPIREAEADIRRRIEFGTFLGNGQKDSHKPMVRKLLSLKSGQKIEGIEDEPQFKYREARFARDAIALDRNFAFAFGKTTVTSTVTFDATRRGDRIHIKGTVTHKWSDEYDFDKEGQPGHKQATILVQAGVAKPFGIAAEWKQDVEGWVEIRDGRPTNPRFTWTDRD